MIEHYKKFQFFYLTFLAIIFAGLAAYYLIHFGYYPVAMVNSDLISAKTLNEEFAAALRYYSAALKGKDRINIESREFRREIRRATLSDLIDKSLIYKEAKNRVGNDLDNLVNNKIDQQLVNRKNVEDAAKLLYGLNLADFRELVLIPQARKEILEGRLFLEKKDFDSWLSEAEKNAKVFIITPEFYWNSGTLKLWA